MKLSAMYLFISAPDISNKLPPFLTIQVVKSPSCTRFHRKPIISAVGELPTCQDTGTALITGYKGAQVWSDFNEKEAFSKGIYRAFEERNLRYSQIAPLNMFEEKNT